MNEMSRADEAKLMREEIAEMQAKLAKLAKKDKGLKSNDIGVLVPLSERVPSNPAYKHMPKAQFVAEMKRLKEKKAALIAFGKELDAKAAQAAAGGESGAPETGEIKAISDKIDSLDKLHHMTETSLLGRIAALSDEEAKKALTSRLEAKKKELEAPKE